MSTSEEKPGNLRISSPHGTLRRFSRTVLTLLAVLVILLVTGIFAVRTEGGKGFLRDRLAKRLGMEISVGSVHVGWPYDIVIADIESEGFLEGAPGFRCRELRAGIGRKPLYRVAMKAPELMLVRDADARWMPACFAPLGELAARNILEIPRISENTRKSVALYVENGSVQWFDGATKAVAKGVTFRLTPVDIPGRRMYHYYLSVDSAVDSDGIRALGMQREWLASQMIEYLEISAGDAESASTVQSFWEVR